MTSCYTEFPDCIGCAGKRICLCCYSDIMSCKLPKDDEEDIWCHIDKGHTYCGPITTCCMVRLTLPNLTNLVALSRSVAFLISNVRRCSAWMCDAHSLYLMTSLS
jgi:hypothetical protein